MRWITIAVLVAGAVLLAMVGWNTFTLREVETERAAATEARASGEAAAKAAAVLAAAIRLPTLSRQAPETSDPKPFQRLHRLFEEAFPRLHQNLELTKINELSLLYQWQGRDPERPPILLMGHQDVVPVTPGSEGDWAYPPFAGDIAEGFVWGRGAVDDKASLVTILSAIEGLLAEGFVPQRTVYLAFGHDEEVGGTLGAVAIAKQLAAEGVRLAMVLDEGGSISEGVYDGVTDPVATINIAEKGYLSVRLTVPGARGHASLPPPHTAIGTLAQGITRLEAMEMPRAYEGPMRQTYEALAPAMAVWPRVLFANPGLLGWAAEHYLARQPLPRAMMETTRAVTMTGGGTKDNVLPPEAWAVVNFRLRPGETIDGVIDRVRDAMDLPHMKVEKLLAVPPSPVSDTEGAAYRTLAATIQDLFPEVRVVPGLLIAATDSRHYTEVSDAIFRFLPNRFSPADYGRVHGTNERIALSVLGDMTRFYRQLILNMDGLESRAEFP